MFDQIKKVWQKIWHDVVSRVISSLVATAILAAIAAVWYERQRLPDWTLEFRRLLLVPIPLWVAGCLAALVSVVFLLRGVRSSKRPDMTPMASIVRATKIPARLKVGIKLLKPEIDPSRIAIIIQNTGGTDALHVHISDVHIFQKTARFTEDVASIPSGTGIVELRPVIIEYPDSYAHDVPGAMFEAT